MNSKSMMKTRFAPSPTGMLHVGGARTALFCWLFSQKMGGQFILRIEDTDLERSTQDSVQAILDGMSWLKLNYDEGPYYQTKRFERYQAVIQQLLDQGDAYYCACSKDRLDTIRAQQMAEKQKPRYDGYCRNLGLQAKNSQTLVVRFKTPLQGSVIFVDQIKGEITVGNNELDDLVIARGDGSPTYNLSVVVDDIDMAITHVVRGDDHVNNTPRQINIFKALGVEPPLYAHVPMILGDDGKRLSKRHGAMGVMQYCEDGYLPEAMLNYLVRLGWSHGNEEIFSIDEMIKHFSLSEINRAPSIFNTDKLKWLNQRYLMSLPLTRIVDLVKEGLKKRDITYDSDTEPNTIVDLYRQRVSTINELIDSILYCFQEFEAYDEKAAKKTLRPAALKPLQCLRESLEKVTTWQVEEIHDVIERTTQQLGVSMAKIGQPLRVAVTGSSFSPPIDQTLTIIGKARSLQRISKAIAYITSNKPSSENI